jgi:hypothetical protein
MTTPETIYTVRDWRLKLLLFIARRLGLTWQTCGYHERHRCAVLATSRDVSDEMIDHLFYEQCFRNAVKQERLDRAVLTHVSEGVH